MTLYTSYIFALGDDDKNGAALVYAPLNFLS